MKAKNGTEIKPGQTWLSADDEFTSYVVGFSSAGYPVIEKGQGWGWNGREFVEIEKYWKSVFLDHEKTSKKDAKIAKNRLKRIDRALY